MTTTGSLLSLAARHSSRLTGRRESTLISNARSLSSAAGAGKNVGTTGKKSEDSSKNADPNRPRNPQEFVKIRFEPGEWDPRQTDPLYLPPWKNKARVISEEDYTNRPTAGFSEEFRSLYDARVTFTWMNQETKDEIYQDYLNLMEAMKEREKVTSHEYVMHVIARKYNIMPDRVAAIVQLAHNEERIKQEHPEREIHYDLAKTFDEKMQRFIQEVYSEYGEVNPREFVEELLERGKGSRATVDVDDLYDVDELNKQAILRERDLAQRIIDTKVYIEDFTPSQVEVKINQECRDLIKAHKEMKVENDAAIYSDVASLPAVSSSEKGEAAAADKGERRPRWKFVAHTINTREKKKKNGTVKEQNAIVEQDGNLRVATQEEFHKTSWKPKRNLKEFMLRDVKKGWMDKNQKGDKDAWGRAVVKESNA